MYIGMIIGKYMTSPIYAICNGFDSMEDVFSTLSDEMRLIQILQKVNPPLKSPESVIKGLQKLYNIEVYNVDEFKYIIETTNLDVVAQNCTICTVYKNGSADINIELLLNDISWEEISHTSYNIAEVFKTYDDVKSNDDILDVVKMDLCAESTQTAVFSMTYFKGITDWLSTANDDKHIIFIFNDLDIASILKIVKELYDPSVDIDSSVMNRLYYVVNFGNGKTIQRITFKDDKIIFKTILLDI